MRIAVDGIFINNQTIGAAATVTPAIVCLGAHKVSFWVTATDAANQLGGTSLPQVSNDGVNWFSVGAAATNDLIMNNTLSGGVLNAGGRMSVMMPCNVTAGFQTTEGICWKYVRLSLIRSAADVTGVTARITVLDAL